MEKESVKELLHRFNYGKKVDDIAEPILQVLLTSGTQAFERAVCSLASRLIHDVENGKVFPKEADQIFTLLDTFCSERNLQPPLSEDVEDILLEGQHFHHYGDQKLGPELSRMKKIIERNPKMEK